jgi:hypothetical protein
LNVIVGRRVNSGISPLRVLGEVNMKFRKCVAVTLLLLPPVLSVSASQQENGVNAIKTADGFVLVWNQPDIHFTLGVKGKDVRPLNSTEHVFFNVDGVVFQVQSVAIGEFMKDAQKKRPDDRSVLMAHRDWESRFIEGSLLGKKLDVKTVPRKLGDGSEALLWKFEMPEGVSSGAKEQIYLTVVRGDQVILLNGVIEGDVTEDAVEKFLLDTVTTLRVSPKPINLRELQESIRKGSS